MIAKNITMVRGDTLSFGVQFRNLNQDLDAAYFSCKVNPTDENYVFQKTLGDGIEKVSDGVYRVRVAPEDTENLEARMYYFDFEIHMNEDVKTPMLGTLDIKQDVTFTPAE